MVCSENDQVVVFSTPDLSVYHCRADEGEGSDLRNVRVARIDICAMPCNAEFDTFLEALRTFIDEISFRVVLQIRHVGNERLEPPDMPSMLRIAGSLLELGERFDNVVCGTIIQVRCIDPIVRLAYDTFHTFWKPKRPIEVTTKSVVVAKFTQDLVQKHQIRSCPST